MKKPTSSALMFLLLAMLIVPTGAGQEKPKKQSQGSGVWSVTLRDGSRFIGIVKLDAVKLKTGFGTLTFPIKDIRSITFPTTHDGKDTIVTTDEKDNCYRGCVQLEKAIEVDTGYGMLKIPAEAIKTLVVGNRISFKIGFTSGGQRKDIYIINEDGSEMRKLIESKADNWCPAWSPDGTKIAFNFDGDGHTEVYVIDADGSNMKNLTNSKGNNRFPDWSPDGKKIVFDSNREGGPHQIYVMDADGSNVKQLTHSEVHDTLPVWSPNGQKIAFSHGEEIWIMNADGSDKRRLTDYKRAGHSSWSPDGKKIAFQSNQDGNFEIYVMDADGSNPRKLTDNKAENFSASWSPDGMQILFVSTKDGSRDLYIMDSDGSNVKRLTNNMNAEWRSAWVPCLIK